MTFLTDLKTRERSIFESSGMPLGAKGIFDFLAPEEVAELMKLVTDAVFKNETIMYEIFDDEWVQEEEQQIIPDSQME